MDKIIISRRNITPVALGRVLDRTHLGSKLNQIPDILNDGNTMLWVDYKENITKDELNQVSIWGDKSGNSNNLVAAGQPILQSDGVYFDGIDDYMIKAFTLSQPCHVYLIAKQVTYTKDDVFFDGATGRMLLSPTATNQVSAYAGAALANNGALINEFQVFEVLYNGASSRLTIGDITVTGNLGTQVAGGIVLASNAGTKIVFANVVFKEVIVRKIADTTENIALIVNYLKKKVS
jgi:hypothetical protein